ncbi:hypothetical protein HDU93_000802 [Gonapodya sp. JEL0774]|nr:hypothetical protein HDU93_000802 [Gonapodya sp. JEL0774]
MEKGKTLPEVILSDHESLRKLFARYKSSADEEERRRILNEYIREISLHSTAEEYVLYPTLISLASSESDASSLDIPARIEKERADHHRMKETMRPIDRLLASGNEVTNAEGFGFSPEVEQLLEETMEAFDRHMRGEEEVDLVLIKSKLRDEELVRLGREFEDSKLFSPTRPHPDVPESGGIAEKIVAASLGAVDRTLDLGRSFAKRDD